MTAHRSRLDPLELRSISNVYALLARLWLREVDQTFAAQLNQPPLLDAFESIGGLVPSCGELDNLAVQYCRWFIGPKDHLPPLQSVWHNGQLQSETTDSIRSFAAVLGYQTSDTNAGGMPDHLGIQLDIMAQAIRLAADCERSVEAREATAEFFRRHLTWPNELFERALQRNDSAFYRAIVGVTKEFLVSEHDVWIAQLPSQV